MLVVKPSLDDGAVAQIEVRCHGRAHTNDAIAPAVRIGLQQRRADASTLQFGGGRHSAKLTAGSCDAASVSVEIPTVSHHRNTEVKRPGQSSSANVTDVLGVS